jgi:hypothetical protein
MLDRVAPERQPQPEDDELLAPARQGSFAVIW